MSRVDGVEVEPTRPHAVTEAAPITKRQDLRRKVSKQKQTPRNMRRVSPERRIQI